MEAGARTSLGVSPKLERKRPVKDIGDPMLAQHFYADVSAAAIANGHGWNRFLHTVSLAAPRRYVAVAIDEPTTDDEAAN